MIRYSTIQFNGRKCTNNTDVTSIGLRHALALFSTVDTENMACRRMVYIETDYCLYMPLCDLVNALIEHDGFQGSCLLFMGRLYMIFSMVQFGSQQSGIPLPIPFSDKWLKKFSAYQCPTSRSSRWKKILLRKTSNHSSQDIMMKVCGVQTWKMLEMHQVGLL